MAITYYHNEKFRNADLITKTAGEAIAFSRAAVVLSSGEVVKCTADTDAAQGLTYDSYADGDQAQIIQEGHLRFVAGGTIAVDDPLCPDDGTAGRIRTAVSGDRVVGYATETAAAGEFGYGNFNFRSSHLLA